MIFEIIRILSSARLPLDDEKKLQLSIIELFDKYNIPYQREYILDSANVPDFFIDGIAIEIKIKGNAKKIYKQCERYCRFDQVKQIMVVTNRSMGFPQQISGKDCYVIKLGKSWL